MLFQLVWKRFCVLCNTAWKAWTESWKWNKSVNVDLIVQSTQWSWKSINTKHVLHISIWISSCHSAMVTHHQNVCFQHKNHELESYSAICVEEIILACLTNDLERPPTEKWWFSFSIFSQILASFLREPAVTWLRVWKSRH